VPARQHISVPDLKPGGERPLVSMEGWARFEQKARQRRLEKRLEAAKTAIRSGNFVDARAALAELTELDADHPEVKAIGRQLDRAEKAARPRRGAGAFAAAAAAFVAVVLGASWLGDRGRLQSHPMVESVPAVPVVESLLASREITLDVPMATSGAPQTSPAGTVFLADAALRSDPVEETSVEMPVMPPPRPVAAAVLPPAFLPPAVPPPQIDLPPATDIERPVVLPSPALQRKPPAPEPIAAAATPTAGARLDVVPAVVDDTSQVRAVLQKYQAGYERLDARMVHAVWPGVNEVALARAFEGLESQALNFRACDVQLRGATASAVCTGSARYVPKIGSREPRVESLAWNFTLRKRANDWEIETARAER
jgi:hypothetical protein